jgi:hypothetical protein
VEGVGAEVRVSAGVSELGRSAHFSLANDAIEVARISRDTQILGGAPIGGHGHCCGDCGYGNDYEQLKERKSILPGCVAGSDGHTFAPMNTLPRIVNHKWSFPPDAGFLEYFFISVNHFSSKLRLKSYSSWLVQGNYGGEMGT